MSLTDKTEVTAEAVRETLAELETTYKEVRTAVLAKLNLPYQARRKKLTRLLAVLEDEAEPEGGSDD